MGVYNVHSDHLGSDGLLTGDAASPQTDADGVLMRTMFTPFGEVSATVGVAPTGLPTHGFTDHEHDQESGLIHMESRYYDPQLGRFVSPDPALNEWGVSFHRIPRQPQAANAYTYVENRPSSLIDPTGEAGEPVVPPFALDFVPIVGGLLFWKQDLPELYDMFDSGDPAIKVGAFAAIVAGRRAGRFAAQRWLKFEVNRAAVRDLPLIGGGSQQQVFEWGPKRVLKELRPEIPANASMKVIAELTDQMRSAVRKAGIEGLHVPRLFATSSRRAIQADVSRTDFLSFNELPQDLIQAARVESHRIRSLVLPHLEFPDGYFADVGAMGAGNFLWEVVLGSGGQRHVVPRVLFDGVGVDVPFFQ